MTLKDKKKRVVVTATPEKHHENVKRRKRRQYLKKLKCCEEMVHICKLFYNDFSSEASAHEELDKICKGLTDKILKYEYTFNYEYFNIKGYEYNPNRDCFVLSYENKVEYKDNGVVYTYDKTVNITTIDDMNVFVFGTKYPHKSSYVNEPTLIGFDEYATLAR